ncbi:MAG: type II toxin-antitoxin system RelE/ParE family toxin [Bdellovibrio sp.]|nr:type II toxin-antitoxin system RelE/ParE family toxin [Bdellovibrio sp.]
MEIKGRTARFYRTEGEKEPAREWLDSLKDKVGQAKIFTRIRRAETGNFGDHKVVGEGVSELRITHGPGYRIYYGVDDNDNLIILLVAGDKSTQEKDIENSKLYWKDYKKRR